MLLTKVHVKKFRSIDDSSVVEIEPDITVLVGQNESGKTAFLQALSKSVSPGNSRSFSVMEDYPRRALSEYQRRHDRDPQPVLELHYSLTEKELEEIDKLVGCKIKTTPTFTVNYNYANQSYNNFFADEESFLTSYVVVHAVPESVQTIIAGAKTIREAMSRLQIANTLDGNALFNEWFTRFQPNMTNWTSLLNYELWFKLIQSWVPTIYYFDDYYLLPGKINLRQLAQNPHSENLEPNLRTALSLLAMAGVSLDELNENRGYEEVKAKLEGISNSITDKIFRYWQQNRDLQVEFDIRSDPQDVYPYNTGPNLYIRIRNTRHRVSVPFNQRSKGFIWFFSFIVWFDTVQQTGKVPPILLLDEPGLSLHALAQGDLLTYIDDLAKEHQVIYSTHSPFMVRHDSLEKCRLVEDRLEVGSVVSEVVPDSNKRTLFPLQAALGYGLMESLLIARKNLLVKGPSELVYLKYFSGQLELLGKKGLRDDVVIVPMGGLDKAVNFLALATSSRMELVLLQDSTATPDQKLDSILKQRTILNFGAVFESSSGKKDKKTVLRTADIEDLLSPELYIRLLLGVYGKKLGKLTKEADLPAKEHLLSRIAAYFEANNIELKPALNNYLPATYLVSNAIPVDQPTLDRFETLFTKINALY